MGNLFIFCQCILGNFLTLNLRHCAGVSLWKILNFFTLIINPARTYPRPNARPTKSYGRESFGLVFGMGGHLPLTLSAEQAGINYMSAPSNHNTNRLFSDIYCIPSPQNDFFLALLLTTGSRVQIE